MYFYLGPRPEFHLIKTNEASHFHIYVTLRALTVVVIKSDDEKFGTRKDYSQGRRSNQCHCAMALVDFLPRSLKTLSTNLVFLNINQKASKPRKWHWLSLPPIGALDYSLYTY